uniref:Putative zinc finger, CCHC-type n=1 Tax=Tanacetum cinerariifolium TaxID=118510 RepID=A0A699HRB1_TANCI|nr:putative zinc finger, CCHC-type [Tanacetum cinerariifolium]
MDLDHALRIDPPAALTAESTTDQKRAYEQGGDLTEYLSSVEQQFKGTSKAHASTLIRKMLTTKYDRRKLKNQLDRKIKVVRSNGGCEYYGRHTDVGKALGSFFNFCKDHGIINQYTMSDTPQHNGVAERRNSTLMDMVRSMLANSNLPEFLWTEALKTDVYILNRADFDLGKCNDPESFEDAITYDQSAHWKEAMEDELNSMSKNHIWKLAELLMGAKPVRCKWVYKTKLDPNENVERYKTRLVAKGYTQKEGVDYKETFSPVLRKDSLRIVMALL